MSLLRRIWKWWRQFWGPCFDWEASIDSHKWENKAEMFRRLSHHPC